jgi:hypothetical protein
LPFFGLDESSFFSLSSESGCSAEFVLCSLNRETLWEQVVSCETSFYIFDVTGSSGRTYILQE